MKKLLLTLVSVGVIALGAVSASAQTDKKEKRAKKKDAMASAAATESAPKSVIHIITVNFKEGTTPEQIKTAIDGAHALPGKYKGITHVWTRAIKNQTDKSHIIVMEFASEQALKDYADSDAQKEWYKVYEAIRERSVTSDVTN